MRLAILSSISSAIPLKGGPLHLRMPSFTSQAIPMDMRQYLTAGPRGGYSEESMFRYYGGLIDDKKNGDGTWVGRYFYEGEWKDDVPHGRGLLCTKNLKIDGQFKHGQLHGRTKATHIFTKDSVEAEWKEGTAVSDIVHHLNVQSPWGDVSMDVKCDADNVPLHWDAQVGGDQLSFDQKEVIRGDTTKSPYLFRRTVYPLMPDLTIPTETAGRKVRYADGLVRTPSDSGIITEVPGKVPEQFNDEFKSSFSGRFITNPMYISLRDNKLPDTSSNFRVITHQLIKYGDSVHFASTDRGEYATGRVRGEDVEVTHSTGNVNHIKNVNHTLLMAIRTARL